MNEEYEINEEELDLTETAQLVLLDLGLVLILGNVDPHGVGGQVVDGVGIDDGVVEAVLEGLAVVAAQGAHGLLDLLGGQLVRRSDGGTGSLLISVLHVHASGNCVTADGVQRQSGLIRQELVGLVVHVVDVVQIQLVGHLHMSAVGLHHDRDDSQ